jgi:AraC-like DNA-binding protein
MLINSRQDAVSKRPDDRANIVWFPVGTGFPSPGREVSTAAPANGGENATAFDTRVVSCALALLSAMASDENAETAALPHTMIVALKEVRILLRSPAAAGEHCPARPAVMVVRRFDDTVTRRRLDMLRHWSRDDGLSTSVESAEARPDETGPAASVPALVGLPSRTRRTPLPKWRLRRAFDYIESHLGEPITLPDLAASTGLTRMHFAGQFRAATGVRPHEYLVSRRIARARELLATSKETLVDVALSVGFQNQAHFTTVFKRVVGETPSRWRRENREIA